MPEAPTKQCPHCKAQIDASATKCMHCKTDFRNWFARHPVIVVILGLLLLSLVGNIIEKYDSSKADSSNTGSSSSYSGISKEDQAMLDSLQIISYKIENNVIGVPELMVKVKNNSTKDLDAYTIAFDLYNNFDERISEWNQHEDKPFTGLSQDLLKAGKTEDATFMLSTFDKATKAKNPRVIRIHFTDGSGVK